MTSSRLLTEDMRVMMGVAPRPHGGVPVMFQRSDFEGTAPPPEPEVSEGRMTLYRDEAAMEAALGRAYETVARVSATLRKRPTDGMNERERTAVERVERKLGTAIDALEGARAALTSMCKKSADEE